MLWRVRATLPDRPGALAALAVRCGEAEVNILGLQIFPGVGSVTDEFVLRAPEGWDRGDVVALIEESGGESVRAGVCTDSALRDQPMRYLQAARTILAEPARFPEVVAGLFDAATDRDHARDTDRDSERVDDVMEMAVGDIAIQIRRPTPFTPTEHARGAAMAHLVTMILERSSRLRSPDEEALSSAPLAPLSLGRGPDYRVEGDAAMAMVEGKVIALATLRDPAPEPGTREITLWVDPAWQRRGIGTRMLHDLARLAATRGVDHLVMVTDADNSAVLPLVQAAGLPGRIRMSGDMLTVRISVRSLRANEERAV